MKLNPAHHQQEEEEEQDDEFLDSDRHLSLPLLGRLRQVAVHWLRVCLLLHRGHEFVLSLLWTF